MKITTELTCEEAKKLFTKEQISSLFHADTTIVRLGSDSLSKRILDIKEVWNGEEISLETL